MKLNINNQPIAVRVVSFSADLDRLCLDREQLILDIFAEVNKRKRPEAQWAYLMQDVAEPIAKHYKCEARYTRTGTIAFYDGDDRQDTATSRFRALVASTGLVSGSGNTNKAQKKEPEVTPRKTKRVSELLRAIYDLSAAERAALMLDLK
jgi:hypothetical protein